MNNVEESTGHKQHLTDKIVQTATDLFVRKGIKAVKMDDIAKEQGISKRTLYETFENKEQLLLECVKRHAEEKRKSIDEFIAEKHPTVIAIIAEFYRTQLQEVTIMCSSFYIDLHKYPSVMKWLEQYRSEREQEGIDFFSEGVEEGYFRKDVDYKLIVQVCDGAMEYIFNHKLFKNYSMKQIFQDVTMLYIRGFCTLKGIAELEKVL